MVAPRGYGWYRQRPEKQAVTGTMTRIVYGLFQAVAWKKRQTVSIIGNVSEQRPLGEGFLSLECGHNYIHVGFYLGVRTTHYILFFD